MKSLEELAEFNKKFSSKPSLEDLHEIIRILKEVKNDFQNVFKENPSYEYVGKRIDVEFNNLTSAINKLIACGGKDHDRLNKDCVNSLTRLVETFPEGSDGDLPKELKMLRTEVANLVAAMKNVKRLRGLDERVFSLHRVPCFWSPDSEQGFVQSANKLVAVAEDVEGAIGKALENTCFLFPPADPYLVVAHSQVRYEIGRLAEAMTCFIDESKEYVVPPYVCTQFAKDPTNEYYNPDQNTELKDCDEFWSEPGYEAADALNKTIPVRVRKVGKKDPQVGKKDPLGDKVRKVNSKAKIRRAQDDRRIACLDMARWLSATASAVEEARWVFAVERSMRSNDPRCFRLKPRPKGVWGQWTRKLGRSKLGDDAFRTLRRIFQKISQKLNAAAMAMENLDAYTNSGAAQTVLKRGAKAHAEDFWETYSRVALETLYAAPHVSPFNKNYITTKYKPFIEQLDEKTK